MRRLSCGLRSGLVVAAAALPLAAQEPAAAPAEPAQAPPVVQQAPPSTRVETTKTVPFGFPPAGTNLESHLPSSSQAREDINASDRFDLAPDGNGSGVVRGDPTAPGILADDVRSNTGLHVVRPGDTLSGISQQAYGQPWMWPKLWSLNPQIQNPHWIYPGDHVRLTDVATATGKPQGVRTLGAGGLIDRRQAVPEDTVFLRRSGYIDDPAKGIVGEIVGAKQPVQLISEGDIVYLAMKPGTRFSRGQKLTIFRPSRRPPSVSGARRPPGMIVAIQGTVLIDYVDQQNLIARGEVVEALDVIERGAKVGELGRRFEVVPPKKATQDVSARILTSMYPHVLMAEQQVVFIDRGFKDGLEAGHRLFVVRRGDTWRRTLSTSAEDARTRIKMDSPEPLELEATPLHGDEQKLPEEIVGELRVVEAHPFSAYAVITDSRVELVPGDRAIARQGF